MTRVTDAEKKVEARQLDRIEVEKNRWEDRASERRAMGYISYVHLKYDPR